VVESIPIHAGVGNDTTLAQVAVFEDDRDRRRMAEPPPEHSSPTGTKNMLELS